MSLNHHSNNLNPDILPPICDRIASIMMLLAILGMLSLACLHGGAA